MKGFGGAGSLELSPSERRINANKNKLMRQPSSQTAKIKTVVRLTDTDLHWALRALPVLRVVQVRYR